MKEKEDGFVRDVNTGNLLNTDNNGLKAYKLKKQKNKEIDILKDEVKDIKNMLTLILEKIK
jgi:predicted transcriptional regulator with HTH domain